MNEKRPAWDQDVPVHLRPAIKALRQLFEDGRWKVGHLTQVLAFACLHGETLENLPDYLLPLQHLKVIIGPMATQGFHHHLNANTPSAIFKAFWDLLLGGMSVEMIRVFEHILEIARANEAELGAQSLHWAQAMVERMIHDETYAIESWVREVCDKQVDKPDEEDPDEWIFWRKWQAPSLLIMTPSGPQRYEEHRIWERQDVTTSLRWLRHFSQQYKISLESKLQRAVGEAAVSAAKRPNPSPTPPPASKHEQHLIVPETSHPASSRREKQKKATLKRHAAWERQYEALKVKNPGRSDVWYSRKIASMGIAEGASPETIRKNMK